jgi:metal-responsive CopG/Arc/MetJ family transcriptional regulator
VQTKKITVSLTNDTLELANENYERFGFQTRSEFVDAAIREYVSRDLLSQFSGELAGLYGKIERSEIKDMEQHLAKLSYKVAVEIATLNLAFASALELSVRDADKLRGKAVQLVNKSCGYVPLRKAVEEQVKLDFEL